MTSPMPSPPRPQPTAKEIAARARAASALLADATAEDKSAALRSLADTLLGWRDRVLEANRRDTEAAEAAVSAGKLSASLAKRLDLSGTKYDAMVAGVRDVEKLEDPTGERALDDKNNSNAGVRSARAFCQGAQLRPVSERGADRSGLLRAPGFSPSSPLAARGGTLKRKRNPAGNAAILKGGKEAAHTNAALHAALREALYKANRKALRPDAILSAETRDQVSELLHMDQEIDLVVPRGSADLVRHIKRNTTIPVLGHADGLCSVYVDEDADVELAARVIFDSKTSYPAACNSAETLLVHRSVLGSHLPRIAEQLRAGGVTLRCDAESLAALGGGRDDKVVPSSPADYDTEFLDLTIAVKAVGALDEAVAHVSTHGSRHTEVILTASRDRYEEYARRVDAAGVYWNASSRFADGFRYGFGAEVG
ncbi:MAG: Aldehyde/histidinol dehydrogenase, partial [Olpidium bornovanus]